MYPQGGILSIILVSIELNLFNFAENRLDS